MPAPPRQTAHQKTHDQLCVHADTTPVGPHRWGVGVAVHIQQLAQLNAQIGQQTGDVGGADDGA